MTSPKTSAAALLAVVIAIAATAYSFLDGDPSTMPDWTLVGIAISAAIGFFYSRDNDKTSENVGAK